MATAAAAARSCCPCLRPSLASTAHVAVGTLADAQRRVDAIASLVCDAFPEHREAIADGDDLIDTLMGFHEPERCTWLFCTLDAEPRRLAGLLMAVRYHDRLHVASLSVDAALRGRGLGSHLMRSASALAASLGLPLISGSVSADAPHLARLYARLGGTAHPPPPSSGGSAGGARSLRWDAPSGKPTALDTPAPLPLRDDGDEACRSLAQPPGASGAKGLGACRMLLLVLVAGGMAAPPPPARVAIVGGGLAGLGCAVSLLDEAAASCRPLEALHIVDPCVVGTGGASAVAAGLLHPFTPRGREIWLGREGFEASVSLVRRVEALPGFENLRRGSGLLRLAATEEKAEGLRAGVDGGGDDALEQRWLGRDEATAHAAADLGDAVGASFAPGALSIDTPTYLRGLWALCEATATATGSGEGGTELRWRTERVPSLRSLQAAAVAEHGLGYDAIILTVGSRAAEIDELSNIALTLCRGQNLVLRNPQRLSTPLIRGKYLVPRGEGNAELLAGATFEYDEAEVVHRGPEAEAAEAALKPPLAEMHPPVADAEVLEVQAGVRALPPRSHLGYVPIAGRVPLPADEGASLDAEAWLLGGLGSRGLIHHAVLGKALARAVLSGDEGELPEHTRRLESREGGMLCGAKPRVW